MKRIKTIDLGGVELKKKTPKKLSKRQIRERNISKILNLGDLVANELTRKGVIVHHYKSLSSNSLYYKFDYGLAYSLRISDHASKEHLHYRFNALTTLTSRKTIKLDNGLKQTFFDIKQGTARQIIKAILKERDKRISKYGRYNYNRYMDERRLKSLNHNDKGFWSGAELYKLKEWK